MAQVHDGRVTNVADRMAYGRCELSTTVHVGVDRRHPCACVRIHGVKTLSHAMLSRSASTAVFKELCCLPTARRWRGPRIAPAASATNDFHIPRSGLSTLPCETAECYELSICTHRTLKKPNCPSRQAPPSSLPPPLPPHNRRSQRLTKQTRVIRPHQC